MIVFALIGKFCIMASFSMAYIYALEVYPTSIRSTGLNMCSTFARVASVLASYVGMLVGTLPNVGMLMGVIKCESVHFPEVCNAGGFTSHEMSWEE